MERIYFRVPYEQRAEAKECGGRWDPDFSQWYAGNEEVRARMQEKGWQQLLNSKKRKSEPDRILSMYFDIPAEDACRAEQKGAEYDFEKRCYHAPNETVWKQLNEYWEQVENPTPCEFPLVPGAKLRDVPSDECWRGNSFEIPYKFKDQVKTVCPGIKWDKLTKKWCATNKRTWDHLRQMFEPYVMEDEQIILNTQPDLPA